MQAGTRIRRPANTLTTSLVDGAQNSRRVSAPGTMLRLACVLPSIVVGCGSSWNRPPREGARGQRKTCLDF